MTKYYLPVLLFFISQGLCAQVKQNDYLLGGNLAFRRSVDQSNNVTTKTINGKYDLIFGKVYKNNKVAGIRLSYSPFLQNINNSIADTVKTNNHMVEIGAFVRTYKKLADKFYFYGQLAGSYTSGSSRYKVYGSTNENSSTRKGVLLAITPGISYELYKNFQVELASPNIIQAGYTVSKFRYAAPSSANRSTDLFLSSQLRQGGFLNSLSIGFSLIL